LVIEHRVPRDTTPIYGTVEIAPYPVREWSGGVDLRGQPRVAGYVGEIAPGGDVEAYGYIYRYQTMRTIHGRAWIHRALNRLQYLGSFTGTDAHDRAVDAVLRGDREATHGER
jgi:hypothetical protein